MSRNRASERGITILLVAAAMVAILAMAALAVDIVALYVARGETQRAADASALAGAKMFVFSGYTSNSSVFSSSSQLCVNGGAGGAGAVNKAAEGILAQNLVVGQSATLHNIACDLTQPENPRVTVTIQSPVLPTLFSRIWQAVAGTVNATASAEAFNPSGGSNNVAVGSVKPWLIPNCLGSGCTDPGEPNFFTSTYGIANGGAFIGTALTLHRMNPGTRPPSPPAPPKLPSPPGSNWWFYSLDPPQPNDCPGNCSLNGSPYYQDNISCSNTAFQYSCGQQIAPGLPAPSVQFDTRATGLGLIKGHTINGISCLTHGSGNPLTGQDIISTGLPTIITGGSNNPNSALKSVANISRSDSVVTVPVYAGDNACPIDQFTCSATVTGFLQLGITNVNQSNGDISVVIMNAAPCNPANNTQPAVAGGAVSPIPVRLISQ